MTELDTARASGEASTARASGEASTARASGEASTARASGEASTALASGGSGTEPVEVLLRQLDPDLPPPSYAHPGDAGADLVTAEDVVLAPGQRSLVSTGVAIALPAGYAAFVHPRSGLAAKFGVSIVNAPGTVDAGYRGEIKVNLVNHDGRETVRLRRGDRIAQLVVQKVERAVFRTVPELPGSVRGAGGHGSTGGHDGLRPEGEE